MARTKQTSCKLTGGKVTRLNLTSLARAPPVEIAFANEIIGSSNSTAIVDNETIEDKQPPAKKCKASPEESEDESIDGGMPIPVLKKLITSCDIEDNSIELPFGKTIDQLRTDFMTRLEINTLSDNFANRYSHDIDTVNKSNNDTSLLPFFIQIVKRFKNLTEVRQIVKPHNSYLCLGLCLADYIARIYGIMFRNEEEYEYRGIDWYFKNNWQDEHLNTWELNRSQLFVYNLRMDHVYYVLNDIYEDRITSESDKMMKEKKKERQREIDRELDNERRRERRREIGHKSD